MKRGDRVQTPDGPGVYVKRLSTGMVMVQLDDAPEFRQEKVCDVFQEKDVKDANN